MSDENCCDAEHVAAWRKAMGPEKDPSPFANQASAFGAGYKACLSERHARAPVVDPCPRACQCVVCMPYWPRTTASVALQYSSELAIAKAEVESLRARVAEQAWIPVAQRMPEPGVLVALLTPDENGANVCRWCNARIREAHTAGCFYVQARDSVDSARAALTELARRLGVSNG